MDYEELLDKAYKEAPKRSESTERFEIPKAQGYVEGNKTIVKNFNKICDTFRRDPGHLLKYLQRELATPASLDGNRLILGRKIPSSLLNSKIESYANEFIICEECKKPDTVLKKENKITVMYCMACGARHPVKGKI